MATLDDFFASLGLLWERTHLISTATVQAPGVHCAWTSDLDPIGASTVVPAGQLVELRVSLDAGVQLADTSKIRLDILEQDWLFTGGFDDPMSSLKAPGADPPVGDFTIQERLVEQATVTADLPTLRDVVTDYKRLHADDYERGILVVTDPAAGSAFGTEIVAWWRAEHADESDPTLYFVAELPGHRCGTVDLLHVAPLQPGVNVRLIGEVRDSVPAALADAPPVPDAVVALGGTRSRTNRTGEFGLDARVPFGTSTVTVTRPGIDAVTCTLTATQRGDGGTDVTITDSTGATLDTATVPAGATLQDFARLDVTVRPLVHRVSGTVTWPATWDPGTPLPLGDRTVCVLPLAAGAALPQRPATSRAWEALRSAPGVLRGSTHADGTFTVRLVPLTAGAQHLVWVEGTDPRGGSALDVLVRTVEANGMRSAAYTGAAMAPQRQDRRVVDSTYNLLTGTVAGACDVLRVAADPAGTLTATRPGRANPDGFDATPPAGSEALTVDTPGKQLTGLALEVLPLVPMFEAADDQSTEVARIGTAMHSTLDTTYQRGHLVDGIRWVLDARRGPTATWNDTAACAALETTLLTHRLLPKARIDDIDWPWWRADAVSAADYAQVTLGAGNSYAGRTLAGELVTVLTPAVPRLLGLFDRRYAHVTPGHGVFAQPPEVAAPGADWSIHTNRGLWAGTDPQGATATQNYGGEDENVAALGLHLHIITATNGLPSTTSREAVDPTRLGFGQTAGAFAEVDPHAHPDHPRLWQQNAYYWIGAVWDPLHPGHEVVAPHMVTSPANNALDTAAILRRLDLLAVDAGNPNTPLDAWIAIHTNGAQDPNTGAIIKSRRGFDVMYLDVRPTAQSPAPGTQGYVEANTMDRDASVAMAAAIADWVTIQNRGANTYWSVHGNTTKELADTTHHWRDGSVSASMRAAAPSAGLAEITFPPGHQAADFPVAFVELGFHTSPDDASCLCQEWFRYAGATGIAAGLEDIIKHQSRPVDADDLRALLSRAYGGLPAVAALTGGTPMTTATASAWIGAIGGGAPAVPSLSVADVVTAIEAATVRRSALVEQVADAAATAAGWPTDAAHADDRMRAAYGPVLALLGSPPSTDVPSLVTLPRAEQAASRRDLASALGAALGRPATLAAVTAAALGVTPAAVPERPDAQLGAPTVAAAAAAIAALAPVDVLRLKAARITTSRVGQRALTVDLLGTAWPGAATDVSLVVTRGASAVAALTCATRTTTTLVSDTWLPPADTTGLTVAARIVHPTKGTLTLPAVPIEQTT